MRFAIQYGVKWEIIELLTPKQKQKLNECKRKGKITTKTDGPQDFTYIE